MKNDNSVFKFGYILFKGLYTELSQSEKSLYLSKEDNVLFSTALPKLTNETWKEGLGLWAWEEITATNAMISIKIPTAAPRIYNDENELLNQKCDTVWNAMKLCGSFSLKDTFVINGAQRNEKVEIRHYHKYPTWYQSSERDHQLPITKQSIEKWGRIYNKLLLLKGEKFSRFKNGLHCFLKGCEEKWSTFRLPYMVRSIEALILPEKGKTAKQFKQRVSKWWPKDSNFFTEKVPIDVLEEIYNIRCYFDHLHDTTGKYTEQIILKRTFQAEELARIAFKDILLDENKLKIFASDDTIRQYWNK